MGKIAGILMVLGGIAGVLYQWIEQQKKHQACVEEFCVFLHKSIFMMEAEKIKVIDYFSKTISKDSQIGDALQEIAIRLSQNIYSNPQLVWEEVMKEQGWDMDDETFSIILKTGHGFFGRNREENISFLKRQLAELEKQQKKRKELDTKERKVWVPVGMLSGLMIVILSL